MKHITAIRKAVCTIANSLRRAGHSLSGAFRIAWHRVRETRFRAAGVTMENRQKRLAYLKNFRKKDLRLVLRREPDNRYDSNAVQILVVVEPIRKYTVIGYVPKAISGQVSAAMDAGIRLRAGLLDIIGGYSYKENYGLLIEMAV